MSSAVSGINVGAGLSQLYQRLNSGTASSADQSNASADVAAAPGSTDASSGQAVAGARPRHHGHGGGGGFRAKIESAVTAALNDASASGGSADANQIIQRAIAKALGGGSSADAPGDATTTAAATQVATTSNASGASDPDGDGDGGADAGRAGGAGAADSFSQLLQSHGIDAQQFRADLRAAVQDARGGTPDLSAAFKNFPPGTEVDTQA